MVCFLILVFLVLIFFLIFFLVLVLVASFGGGGLGMYCLCTVGNCF